jgi:hypothetical protein
LNHCANPTVIKKIEENVEALEAKRLRLGGKMEKVSSKNYDFDAAVDRVFAFIKNPLSMWQKGDLSRRRLVLRLVFEKTLVYKQEGPWVCTPRTFSSHSHRLHYWTQFKICG